MGHKQLHLDQNCRMKGMLSHKGKQNGLNVMTLSRTPLFSVYGSHILSEVGRSGDKRLVKNWSERHWFA